MRARRPLIVSCLAAVVTLSAAAATAEPRGAAGVPSSKQQMEIVGFSDSGREYVLRVVDENVGTVFQVRDTRRNELLKAYPFREDAEEVVWRRVVRKHDIDEELHAKPDNPRKPYTILTAVKGGELVIYVMKGERIGEYERVDLMETEEGEPAEAFVKQVAWGPRGKNAAIVYHQKIADPLEWEGDFVHAFDFKTYRVDLGDED
ncbi:MAG: hypothetical protein ACQEXJ_01685 [Myxococcota bacterium]